MSVNITFYVFAGVRLDYKEYTSNLKHNIWDAIDVWQESNAIDCVIDCLSGEYIYFGTRVVKIEEYDDVGHIQCDIIDLDAAHERLIKAGFNFPRYDVRVWCFRHCS